MRDRKIISRMVHNLVLFSLHHIHKFVWWFCFANGIYTHTQIHTYNFYFMAMPAGRAEILNEVDGIITACHGLYLRLTGRNNGS